MKYQDERHKEIPEREMVELERDIFNEKYDDKAILGREGLEFSLEEFWKVNRKPYKKGAHKRGYRKRRLFGMMDVENIDGKRILDVGCGRGVESVVCAKYGANVTGVDISEEAIRIARKVSEVNGVYDRCEFSVQNVQNMEFEDEKFDIVFCNAVLHHIMKYEGIIKEMVRVLKSDGKMVFGDSLRRNPVYNFLRDVKRRVKRERIDGDVDLEMSDIREISSYFEKSNFEFYSLFSAFKSVFGESYIYSPVKRSIIYVLYKIDEVLIREEIKEKYSNEIVGKLEVKRKEPGV